MTISRTYNHMLLTILIMFSQTSLATEKSYEDVVRHLIGSEFEKEVKNYAKKANWPNYQLNYELWIPQSINHLPKCKKKLIISARNNDAIPIGNLKRSVSCQQVNNNWRVNITIKSSVSLPVVVADKNINRNSIVSASDIKLEQRTLTKQEDFYSDASHVVGLEALRRIRSRTIINQRDLQISSVINKGDEIVLIAHQEGLTASTIGIALEDGYLGQQIDVQNKTSGNTIRATVTGKNQATTLF